VTNPHDRDADDEGEARYVPTVGDTVTRWRYTLTPTLYTDEDSSTNDLLWQQVLEQRAIRAWLVVLAVLVAVALPVTLIFFGLLLHNTAS
jgi:hypothetical protein